MTKEDRASIWRFAISDIACLALKIILPALTVTQPDRCSRHPFAVRESRRPAPLFIAASFLNRNSPSAFPAAAP